MVRKESRKSRCFKSFFETEIPSPPDRTVVSTGFEFDTFHRPLQFWRLLCLWGYNTRSPFCAHASTHTHCRRRFLISLFLRLLTHHFGGGAEREYGDETAARGLREISSVSLKDSFSFDLRIRMVNCVGTALDPQPKIMHKRVSSLSFLLAQLFSRACCSFIHLRSFSADFLNHADSSPREIWTCAFAGFHFGLAHPSGT